MEKTLKVELTVEQDDGRVIVKTLEGEDAEKWSEFIAAVCAQAELRRANPEWASLGWQVEERRSVIAE